MNESATGRLPVFLLSLSIILKPVYLWKSGIPQISDFFFLTAFLLFLAKYGFCIHPQMKKLVLIHCIFLYTILFVNVCWELILDGLLPVVRITSYYFYNFFVCLFMLMLMHRYNNRLLNMVYNSVLLSVLLQIVIFLIKGGFTGARSVAYFNNPNQLGYHNLLCAAVLLFTSGRAVTKRISLTVGLVCTGVLVMASLSKAAIIPYCIMILYYLLFYKKKSRSIPRIILFIVIVLCLLTLLVIPGVLLLKPGTMLYSVYERISMIGSDADDTLAGRGYTRLLDYLPYLPVGIGEGGYSRFQPPGEFHSTLGNLLLSYGIAGLGSFLLMLYTALKRNSFQELYLFLCILLYGLSHNGIRNPLLWMLLGFVYADSLMEPEGKTIQEPSVLPLSDRFPI